MSYNFRHQFTEETIERVFQWVLNEAGTAGALFPAAVFIDGTPIKASANLNKKIKQEVPAAAKRYRDELLAEINADREAHGKKPFDDNDDPPRPTKKKWNNTSKKKLARRKKAGFKTVTKRTTGPDCGVFVKGKHERQFAYEAHTACDKNGYVLETVVTPGNVPPGTCAPAPKAALKLSCAMFGKTTKNWPMTPDTPLNTKIFMPNARKPLSGSLPMPKKSMGCAIRFIEVWPRSPNG